MVELSYLRELAGLMDEFGLVSYKGDGIELLRQPGASRTDLQAQEDIAEKIMAGLSDEEMGYVDPRQDPATSTTTASITGGD